MGREFVGWLVALLAGGIAIWVFVSGEPQNVRVVTSDQSIENVRSPSGTFVAGASPLADAEIAEEFAGGIAIRISPKNVATVVIPVSFDTPGPYEPHLRFEQDNVLQFSVRTRACIIDFAGNFVWVCRAKLNEWRERERRAGEQLFTPLMRDDVSGTYRLILDTSGKLTDVDAP